jgi:hypothetical protein
MRGMQWINKLRITRMIFIFGLVQTVGIGWFCGGFLLSRVQVNLVSTANSPMEPFRKIIDPPGASAPPFDKTLIIVVDALRLDFLRTQPYSQPGAMHVEAMNHTLGLLDSLVGLLATLAPRSA